MFVVLPVSQAANMHCFVYKSVFKKIDHLPSAFRTESSLPRRRILQASRTQLPRQSAPPHPWPLLLDPPTPTPPLDTGTQHPPGPPPPPRCRLCPRGEPPHLNGLHWTHDHHGLGHSCAQATQQPSSAVQPSLGVPHVVAEELKHPEPWGGRRRGERGRCHPCHLPETAPTGPASPNGRLGDGAVEQGAEAAVQAQDAMAAHRLPHTVRWGGRWSATPAPPRPAPRAPRRAPAHRCPGSAAGARARPAAAASSRTRWGR